MNGGGGADILYGGSGKDRLTGAKGADTLNGGDGADVFIFGKGFGKDRVRDFEDDRDTVRIDDALWTGEKSVEDVLADFGEDIGRHYVLDFGDGNVLTINKVNAGQLLDDLQIV